MQELRLPSYQFKIKCDGGGKQIFDPVRKKYVALTPEEWVRQHIIMFLSEEKKFPLSLFKVEAGLKYNERFKRGDLVIYKNGAPVMIVECKAPAVKVTQETFYQVATYNFVLKVPYLVVSNGIDHYCSMVNMETGAVNFLREIPDFSAL